MDKELSEVVDFRRKVGEERQELGAVVSRVAGELEVGLRPDASPVQHVVVLMKAAFERVKRAVRFGVRTAFAVFGTHYADLDFEAVSSGYVEGYTEEEIAAIHAAADPHADALSARYEAEVLPKTGSN